MRTVVDHESVRSYLDDHLGRAEEILINVRKVKLMPYVMVFTLGEKQHILPMAINKSRYTAIRKSVENGNQEDELGTLTPGTQGVAYIESLREFDIAGCGILIKGYPQGIVFSKICDCGGDKIIPIIGEHYGPYISQNANLYYADDSRDCYEKRGCLDQAVHDLIKASEDSLCIVTLGPNDNIAQIVTGNTHFNEKE